MNLFYIISYLIVICGVVNLIRISALLIGADFYSLSHHIRYREKRNINFTTVSVVIPAYNEGKNILRAVSSIFLNDYPKDKLEVIVVSDGSTDGTVDVLKNSMFYNLPNFRIVEQDRLGKAKALNNGMRNYATGKLVMCLDADSNLDKNALKNAVKYFKKKNVIALASNVKVTKSGGLLNLIQQFEYMICYQMKRAQTFYNIEYIIGGIGSVFRRDFLKTIDFYDGNTVTEDIDLTMKILQKGNKRVRVVYGADVIAFTQGVLSLNDLIKQRMRWKWGRYQTFLKNGRMFFSLDKNFTKGLTWIYLPYAFFGDIAFLLEPLFLMYILFLIIFLQDFFTFISAFCVITSYMILNALAEDSISLKDKVIYVLIAPSMYFLFYILSFAEYAALIKSLINLSSLRASIDKNVNPWQPVERFSA